MSGVFIHCFLVKLQYIIRRTEPVLAFKQSAKHERIMTSSITKFFFLILCRKTKTKVRRKENLLNILWKRKVKTSEPPKARENAPTKSSLLFVMHLIGLETCSSFLDQSQNWFDTFDTPLKTAQIRMANQNIGKYYKDSMRTQVKIKQTA